VSRFKRLPGEVSLRARLVALTAIVAISAVPVPVVHADGSETLPLPVSSGCFGIASYGVAMFGTGAGQVTVNPPGPILAVSLHWVGVDDDTPPSPAPPAGTSTLNVNGVDVIGTQNTVPGPGYADRPGWFSWYANIGPAVAPWNGLGLVDDLNRQIDITGWDSSAAFSATNGATATVIYDTGPCVIPSDIEIQLGVDWYWHGDIGRDQHLSEMLVFAFAPDTRDRLVSVQFGHAGTDASQPNCRGGAARMVTGTGPAPAPDAFDLCDRAPSDRAFGINGGIEIVNDPFTSALLPCVPALNPAPDEPYEAGHPCPGGGAGCPYRLLDMRPIDGGDVGAEWAVVELDVLVPAGTEWVAFQLESEADQDGESGSWAGVSFVFS